MRRYMIQIRYNADSVKGLVANPQDRGPQAQVIMDKLGGKTYSISTLRSANGMPLSLSSLKATSTRWASRWLTLQEMSAAPRSRCYTAWTKPSRR